MASASDGAPPPAHGILPAVAIARLSGRALLEGVASGTLPASPMAALLGFTLVEVGEGRVVFEGEPGPHLLNPLGAVHGGWALALIDTAAGCAAHTLLPAATLYATVETKVNFTRPILEDGGTMRCVGTVIARGRRILTAEARIIDPRDRLMAHGTSTLMVADGETARARG